MPLRDLTRKLKRAMKKSKSHKKQNGAGCGCGSKQSGGRVVKPAEYYGGNSKRYYGQEPMPENHAYGKTNAVSFGSISPDMMSTGPNLGPYPNSSGMMTGGRVKGNNSVSRKSNRSPCSKSKNLKSKRSNKNRRQRLKSRSRK